MTGTILLRNGSPAAGVKISIRPAAAGALDPVSERGAFSPDLFLSTLTDVKGHYDASRLAAGFYAISAEKGGLAAFQDSVALGEDAPAIPPDTLTATGSLTASVAMEPDQDVRNVSIQVLGTPITASPDEDGAFALPGMAEGAYRVRISPPADLEEYGPLDAVLTIRSGQEAVGGSLRLPYSGIPIPLGVTARSDTARGTVQVAWRAVRFPGAGGYRVYRSPGGVDFGLGTLAATVTDTFWVDTVFDARKASGPGSYLDAREYGLQYRILAIDAGGRAGKYFGLAKVTAVSPRRVGPRVGFAVRDRKSLPILGGKEIQVAAAFEGGRKTLSLTWSLNGRDSLMKRTEFPGGALAGSDSSRFRFEAQGGYNVYLISRDEMGIEWLDSVRVETNKTPVIADRSAGFVLKKYEPFLFQPSVLDPDGDSLRFSVRNLPPWAALNPSTGAISGTPGRGQDGVSAELAFIASDGLVTAELPIDLEVVNRPPSFPADTLRDSIRVAAFSLQGLSLDFHGLDPDQDTLVYTVRNLPPWMTLDRNTGIAKGFPRNELASIYPDIVVSVSDGSTTLERAPFTLRLYADRWVNKRLRTNPRRYATVAALNGKIFAIGGGTAPGDKRGMDVYDPATEIWMIGPALPVDMDSCRSYVLGGLIHVLGMGANLEILSFDPARNAWDRRKPRPLGRSVSQASEAVEGMIYMVGGDGVKPIDVYDPAGESWSQQAGLTKQCQGVALAAGKKIYLAGCVIATRPMNVYQPDTDAWTGEPSYGTRNTKCGAVLDGFPFVFGGAINEPFGFNYAIRDVMGYDPELRGWVPLVRHDTVYDLHGGHCVSVDGKGFALTENRMLIFDRRFP